MNCTSNVVFQNDGSTFVSWFELGAPVVAFTLPQCCTVFTRTSDFTKWTVYVVNHVDIV